MSQLSEPNGVASRESIFRLANFRWLLGARAFAVTGSALSPIAIAFAVLELTHNVSQLALVLIARQVTQVLVSLVAGVIADRLERYRVLILADLTACASQSVAAALLLSGHATVPLLLVTSSINGAAAAFIIPAMNGLVPQVVPANYLQKANATLRLSFNICSITGIMLGGIIVAASSAGWAVCFNALTFLFSASLMSRIQGISGKLRNSTSFFSELRVGWREFASRRWLWIAVVQACFYNFAYVGVLTVLGPLIAMKYLGGALIWSIIIGGHNLGYIAGGVIATRLRRTYSLFVGLLLMLAEVPFIAGLGYVSSHVTTGRFLPCAFVTVAAFVGGVGVEIFGVIWDSTIQRQVPGPSVSRVSSYDQLGSLVFVPLGMAAMAPLVAASGATISAYLAAGVMAASVLCAVSVGDVRRMKSIRSDLVADLA